MIRLSEEAKSIYAKYVGADGKVIIQDFFPDELKEAFQHFNDNNINILEMNIDPSTIGNHNPESESEQEIDLDDVVDDIDIDGGVDIVDDIDEDDSDVDMSDLDSIFLVVYFEVV